MDEVKNRVFEEARALEEKLLKLSLFTEHNPNFHRLSKLSRKLLRKQEKYMKKYLSVLKKRLKVWEEIKK